ncbi:efflux RND transporter permease subunit, partial [Marinicauda pacifica]
AVALAAGAVACVFALERELVPEEDRGQISVFVTGPDGVGLDYMEQEVVEIEAVLQPYLDSGVIESAFTVIGRYDLNRIGMTVRLADWESRDISQQDLIAALE